MIHRPVEPIWWLSFASDETGKFRGGCFVAAASFDTALLKTHRLKINPGGEVVATPFPPTQDLKGYELDRLYSREEMEKLGEVEKI